MKIDKRWKWAAMDKSAMWFLYTEKPNSLEKFPVWVSGFNLIIFPGSIAPCKYWRKSLHRIINGKPVREGK
jgi:hypothetical protein